MFENKDALLLDMNSTFMFREDRFGEGENYSEYYRSIGGSLPDREINEIIQRLYEYLSELYPQEEYRECFPSLEVAIDAIGVDITDEEKENIIRTFSFHECGVVSIDYVKALQSLRQRFTLALVADIWSPKMMWVQLFKDSGIWNLFDAYSFSSDHGFVKPSPEPFELVVKTLGLPKVKCLVVGDSVRRDLGGALNASIDCVLVGGAKSELAAGEFDNLLSFARKIRSNS